MVKRIEARVTALEAGERNGMRPLPTVLSDDTPDADIERRRRRGIEAYRFGDAVDLFLMPPLQEVQP